MADPSASPATTASGRPGDGTGPAPSLFDITARLAALGAVVLSSFALVKCYAVAHFSLTTGSALLTTAPLSVLLGTVMSYACWILPLGALALGSLAWVRKQRGGGGGEIVALVLATLAAAALSPLMPLLVTTGSFLLVLAVFHGQPVVSAVAYRDGSPPPRWLRRWTGRNGSPPPALLARWTEWSSRPRASWVVRWHGWRLRSLAVATFFGVALLVVFFWTVTRAWIPVELVTVRADGQETLLVGNVLDTTDGWTTVMRAGDRGLSRFPSEDVLSRQLCHLNGAQPAGQAPIL